MQAAMKLGPTQDGLAFPVPLTEKYRPHHIADFARLSEAKQIAQGLIRAPRPDAFLLVGPPGAGKTAFGMALAEDLPGTLTHMSSQKCDVAALDRLQDRFAYYPERGRWWVSLIDEFDDSTEKAQLRCLSLLDSTAYLQPRFGGGMELGVPPPAIWIFTCNGRGPNHTGVPACFETRFLSRCKVLKFPGLDPDDLAPFLAHVWDRESGNARTAPDFRAIARQAQGNARDALNALDCRLLTQAA